jgi:hypothetical protein
MLTGTGVALGTAPSLWPSSLTYNIWGANEDLVFTNSGTTSMNIGASAYATGGEQDQHHYVTSLNSCGGTVASGSSCTIGIQNLLNYPLSSYNSLPNGVTGVAVVGSLTANILTKGGSVLLQNNTVNGTVTFPTAQVGTPQTATIALESVGGQIVNGQPVMVLGGNPAASLAIGGANPGDFAVSALQPTISSAPSSSCPAASTGTQPCTITVTFTPTAAGTRTAKISLDANGSSTGQYIYVTGTALAPSAASPAPALTHSPAPLNFIGEVSSPREKLNPALEQLALY